MTPGERASSAVINFLSKDIGRAIYLRQKHVSDARGECNGCRSQVTPTMHPCIIRQLAEETIRRMIPQPREATP